MMDARLFLDKFLFQVRLSGMIREGGTILDVGSGMNTTMIEMFGDKWKVTPSDINVGEWNSKIKGMWVVDAENMSHGRAGHRQWDAVILSELLEHLKEPVKALKESYAILAPGGHVIISAPFLYRIHEYGPDDLDTVEPALKDYWRFTPNGLAYLIEQAGFASYWVGRLLKENEMEWMPSSVVGWAQKMPGQASVRLDEAAWDPALPENWREIQIALAEAYEEETNSAGEVESI